jgi:hypothetical protein
LSNADTYKIIGFEVLMAVSTKMAVFWVVAPCSLVDQSGYKPEESHLHLKWFKSKFQIIMSSVFM